MDTTQREELKQWLKQQLDAQKALAMIDDALKGL